MAIWNQNTNQPNESLIAPYSLCREVFYPEKTNTSKVLPSWINTEKLEVQLPPVCSVGHCSIAELYAIPHRQLNEYLGAFTVISWRCESRIVLDYSVVWKAGSEHLYQKSPPIGRILPIAKKPEVALYYGLYYKPVCIEVDSMEKKLTTYDKSSPSLLERIIDGVLRPLPARVSIKMTDLRGGKISWEFVRVPVGSSLPDGNPPSHWVAYVKLTVPSSLNWCNWVCIFLCTVCNWLKCSWRSYPSR